MVIFRQCLTELSARDIVMAGYYSLTFLFPRKHCMQIVSIGGNFHEMSTLVFWEKIFQYVIY